MSAVWVLRPPPMAPQWPVQYHGDERTAKSVLAVHHQARIDSTLTRETLCTPAQAAVLEAAKVLELHVNDHSWSRGLGYDCAVVISATNGFEAHNALTALLEAVNTLRAQEAQ